MHAVTESMFECEINHQHNSNVCEDTLTVSWQDLCMTPCIWQAHCPLTWAPLQGALLHRSQLSQGTSVGISHVVRETRLACYFLSLIVTLRNLSHFAMITAPCSPRHANLQTCQRDQEAAGVWAVGSRCLSHCICNGMELPDAHPTKQLPGSSSSSSSSCNNSSTLYWTGHAERQHWQKLSRLHVYFSG